LTEAEIRRELERLGPFHHEVELPFGLRTRGDRKLDRVRFGALRDHLWPHLALEGRRVLDVACNCGGFSIEAAKSGADYVLGIDVVDRYLDQANFLKRALGQEEVEFRKLAVEDVQRSLGSFDVTFCFGILYHLENPVQGMKQLASVTERVMVVDTRLDLTQPDQPYWLMNFAQPREGADSTSLWRDGRCQFLPSARAVSRLLGYIGFDDVTRVPSHKEWGTFIATRSGERS
jgi:tRNA (mo5U34)-methyltransferase